MSVWFVSPAFGRFAVTRLALAQRAHLAGELAERGVTAHGVIVADDENLDIAREYGFETVEQDNTMLGRRFNDGIQYACENGAEFVVLIGSDDWVHADLFDVMPSPMAVFEPVLSPERPFAVGRPAPQVLTGRQILLVDLAGGRARLCESRGRHGVIPWILPRTVLEPSGFRPVRDAQQRGTDGSLIAGLDVRPEWVFRDPHPFCRVDFKSDVNLNSYDAITGAIGVGEELSDPWAALAEHYPPDLVALARQTSETLEPVAA